MDLSRMLGLIFTVLFVIILFYIILKSLNLMIKDMKHSSKGEESSINIQVIDRGNSETFKKGYNVKINDEVTFGRETDNSLVLDDPYVSGYHARIYKVNDRFVLEDLESTNGTLLNGDKVDVKTYLEDGDIITIGKLKLKVSK